METIDVKVIKTVVIDIPSIRPHRFAGLEMKRQSYLLVQVETDDGIVGVGEGVSPGGPWWSGEAIESQQAMIEHHFAPLLVALGPVTMPTVVEHMDRVAHNNAFAKAAVEMALFDALGKRLAVPVSSLLGGGAARDRIPVRWAVGAAGVEETVAEILERRQQGHRAFKLKMGALPPDEDLERVTAIVAAVGSDADFLVDPNSAWSFRTARWVIPELEAAGVSYVEQPIHRDDLDGLAKLTEHAGRIAIIADEAVCTPADALAIASGHHCDAVAVKVAKAGGLLRGHTVGRIAHAAGLDCYGGTALESPVGTAASAHMFASLPQLALDCELVGPLLLTEEILTEPLSYRNGELVVPDGPGLGIEVDWRRVRDLARR